MISSKNLRTLWADFNYRDSFASQANFSAGHIWNNKIAILKCNRLLYLPLFCFCFCFFLCLFLPFLCVCASFYYVKSVQTSIVISLCLFLVELTNKNNKIQKKNIWNSSMIRIAGKTIFYRHWANAGVMKINDLMASDSRIITYSCFKDKFCFPVSFLEFMWCNFDYQ